MKNALCKCVQSIIDLVFLSQSILQALILHILNSNPPPPTHMMHTHDDDDDDDDGVGQ
jgi:hypothetical protein